MGVVGSLLCFAEVTIEDQALILDEAQSPNSFFGSCSLGTQAFTPCPLGVVGSQQEVDFAIDQKKRTLISVEGRSLDCTENIRGEDVCVQGRYYLFPLPGTGIQPNFTEGP